MIWMCIPLSTGTSMIPHVYVLLLPTSSKFIGLKGICCCRSVGWLHPKLIVLQKSSTCLWFWWHSSHWWQRKIHSVKRWLSHEPTWKWGVRGFLIVPHWKLHFMDDGPRFSHSKRHFIDDGPIFYLYVPIQNMKNLGLWWEKHLVLYLS